MQFTAIVAIFAATCMAAPHAVPAVVEAPHAVRYVQRAAASPAPNTCSILKCAAALGPGGLACVAAAVQEGLDPMTDLPCIAALINDVANPPAPCVGCLALL